MLNSVKYQERIALSEENIGSWLRDVPIMGKLFHAVPSLLVNTSLHLSPGDMLWIAPWHQGLEVCAPHRSPFCRVDLEPREDPPLWGEYDFA
jgi:hypothetical protein